MVKPGLNGYVMLKINYKFDGLLFQVGKLIRSRFKTKM